MKLHVFGSNLTFASSNYQVSAWPELEAMITISPHMDNISNRTNEVCGNVSHAGTRGSTETNDTHSGTAHYSTLADFLLRMSRSMLTMLSYQTTMQQSCSLRTTWESLEMQLAGPAHACVGQLSLPYHEARAPCICMHTCKVPCGLWNALYTCICPETEGDLAALLQSSSRLLRHA